MKPQLDKDNLEQERFILISYLNAKMKSEDWHAVCDAANDLREIDARLEVLNLLTKD